MALYSRVNRSWWEKFERGECEKKELLWLRFADFFSRIGVQADPQAAQHDYHENLGSYAFLIPGAEELCRELKKRGASLNVLTASPHLTLDACLKRLGIYEIFDHVWSCDDFHTSKADPRIYQMAAAELHLDVSEVLFLDDNLNADITARSAGMRVCGVYDDSSRDYAEEIKAVADHYIYDFRELLSI